MLVLAVDTSGRNGSITLARGDATSFELIETVALEGGTFSAQLVPQIAALLASHGFKKRDIGGFAVASGPGSFTGLRVGLAAIKALAEILGQPIAAVSRLEVLAVASGAQGHVVTALDAGRSEVYSGEYNLEGSDARMLSEQLLPLDDFLRQMRGKAIVTPDAIIADAAGGAAVAVTVVDPMKDGYLARVGIGRILAGQTVKPAELEANYIRRSDAEIFAKHDS